MNLMKRIGIVALTTAILFSFAACGNPADSGGTSSGSGSTSGTGTDTEKPAGHTHSWDNGTITKAPTCTEAGTKLFKCSGCDETRTETLPALGHNWDAGKITLEPKCTTAGTLTYTCSRCNAKKTDTIPALGHDWSDEPASDGKYHCGRCDETTTAGTADFKLVTEIENDIEVTLSGNTLTAKVEGETGLTFTWYFNAELLSETGNTLNISRYVSTLFDGVYPILVITEVNGVTLSAQYNLKIKNY